MFGELFDWNLDLDICAMIFIIIMMVYFFRRSNVPLRQNRIYYGLMLISFCIALSDIIATVALGFPNIFPVPVLYAVNMVYYACKLSGPPLFLVFTVAITNRYRYRPRLIRQAYMIPYMIMILILLSTPVTHLVFMIDPAGEYSRGVMRSFVYYEDFLYNLAGILCILINSKYLRRMTRYATILYGLSALVGSVLQAYLISSMQTVSLGATAGILILTLSEENPDRYRENTTGLFNTEGLNIFYSENIRDKKYKQVMLMGILSYQEIRSVYGDEAMNDILEQISLRLRVQLHTQCIFYVQNGRFILFDDDGDVDRLAERLQAIFALPYYFGRGEIMLSNYFAYLSEDKRPSSYEEMWDALMIAADNASVEGENALFEVTDAILEEVAHDVKIEMAVERAISGEGLRIYFQPIYNTEEDRITSAEVLVRIEDKELGLIMPDEFIQKAEESGDILMLGQKIFEMTCEFIKDNNLEELGLEYLEVNLSPVQAMREQLAAEFREIVERYGIDSSQLNIEITETQSVDSSVARDNINALRANGMSISLDDYGTGFSNLVNVMNLPLSIVKIDKSIVWAYFRDHNATLIHVVNLFKESGRKIVCEGVETLEMARTLKQMGVEYEQGYYFSKPVAEDEFLRFIGEFKEVI